MTKHACNNLRKKITAIILSLAAITTSNAATPGIMSHIDKARCDAWVDSVYATMTLRQRVGQLFVPKVSPANVTAAKQTIATYVNTYGIGGLLFSKGTVEQFAILTDYAQSLSKIPLVMTLDGEWGLAMRVTGAPRFPYNMSLGAIDDPRLLYDYGREVARQCSIMGIQVNFAPVLDVNSNPDNPVIGFRSFGENPARVSLLGNAYSRGLEDGGVMAVAKHFPGHGDTSTDSHKTLPTVGHSMSQLKEVDMYPFQEFIDSGLSGIMVGHLNVPALDPTGTPSSLSSKITTSLLKEEMGFSGLVWTDGLAMKGAVNPGENNCVSALKAGADVLLEPTSLKNDIAAVYEAVRNGTIPESLIEERCKKLLAYKFALGLSSTPAKVNIPGLKKKLNSPEAEAVNRRLAAAMVTCLSNKADLLPIRNLDNTGIAVVNIGENANNTFSDFCKKYARIDCYSAGAALSPEKIEQISAHDIVIAAVYNDKATSIDALRKLEKCHNLITAFFLNPYKMSKFAPLSSGTVLMTGENTSLSQEYMAQAVFGGIRVNGTLPVNVNGIAPAGTCVGLMKSRLGYTSPETVGISSTLKTTVDSLVKTGLTTGAFPGCQVLVAKDGYVILNKNYGYTDNTKTHSVTDTTIYDLASVSKAAGTLPGLMLAYDEGLFSLDAPASRYIPELATDDKAGITVSDLLYHESGFPASISMAKLFMDTSTYTGKLIAYRNRGANTIKIARGVYGNNTAKLRTDITSTGADDRFALQVAKGLYVSDATVDTIMSRIHNIGLRSKKGYLYSDLNFALLMELEQNITGRRHEEYVGHGIFNPIGAYHTCYHPLRQHPLSTIAPTETDRFMRRQPIHGYVHDELAAFSGGVQGNAGLFSTADDLAKLCQMWLNGGVYGSSKVLSRNTVEKFTTSKSPNSRRGLGFDKPDMENTDKTPTAPEAHPSTYGHIGFTGTCFWVDPSQNIIYIFLSNRVNPTRDNRAFSQLNIRPAIMSAIYSSIMPH